MAEQQTYNPYSLADIQRYLQGKMSAPEMHAMEKAALQDPFLSDAIEGYSNAPFDVSDQHLNSIAAALGAEKEEAKVIPMPVKKNRWLTVAAAITGVAATGIIALLVFKSPKSNNEAPIAQKQVAPVAADTARNQSSTLAAPAPQADALTNKAIAQNTPPPVKDNTKTVKTDVSRTKENIQFKNVQPLPANAPAFKPTEGDTIRATDDEGLVANKAVTNNNATANNNLPSSGPVYRQNNNLNFAKPDSTATAKAYDKIDAKAAVKPQAEPMLKNKAIGITIQLSPLPGFDSTITVTQLNNKTRQRTISTDTSLIPQGGWETFKEYVARQQHKAVDTTETAFEMEGAVELEFAVDEHGLAKEIKITKSLNAASDKQAIEYVRNWPAWITTKNHKGKVVIQF